MDSNNTVDHTSFSRRSLSSELIISTMDNEHTYYDDILCVCVCVLPCLLVAVCSSSSSPVGNTNPCFYIHICTHNGEHTVPTYMYLPPSLPPPLSLRLPQH